VDKSCLQNGSSSRLGEIAARFIPLADMAKPQRATTSVARVEIKEPGLIINSPPFKTNWAIRKTTNNGITCSLDLTSDERKRPVTIEAKAVSISDRNSSSAGDPKKID
jgi:hypothetical protein